MKQLFELSSFDGRNQLRILNPNIHAVIIAWSENFKDGMLYTCTIHSKGVQLISDNYPVHSDFFLLEYQLYHSLLICFQVKWRHYSVETLHDIAQSVTDSSRNNHNTPQLVEDEGCPVKLYDWKTFLKQFLSHFLHSQHIIIFVLIKNHLELSLSKSTATLWKRNSGC